MGGLYRPRDAFSLRKMYHLFMSESGTGSGTKSEFQTVLFGWAATWCPVRWAYGPADVPPYDPSRGFKLDNSLEIGEYEVEEDWGEVKPPPEGPYPRLVRAEVAGQGVTRTVAGSKLLEDLDNAGCFLASSRADAEKKFANAVLEMATKYTPVLHIYGGKWGVGWGDTSLQGWRELVIRVRLYLEVLNYLKDTKDEGFPKLQEWLMARWGEFPEQGCEYRVWRFFLVPFQGAGCPKGPRQYREALARSLYTTAGVLSRILFPAQTDPDGALELKLHMGAGAEDWALYELAGVCVEASVDRCKGCGLPMLRGRAGKRRHSNPACRIASTRKKAALELSKGIPIGTPEPKRPKKARGS